MKFAHLLCSIVVIVSFLFRFVKIVPHVSNDGTDLTHRCIRMRQLHLRPNLQTTVNNKTPLTPVTVDPQSSAQTSRTPLTPVTVDYSAQSTALTSQMMSKNNLHILRYTDMFINNHSQHEELQCKR